MINLDLKNASPEQIQIYKDSWLKNGHRIAVDSTMDVEGKRWCRNNLQRWNWSFQPFSEGNKHTFIFEQADVAKQFVMDVATD